MEEFDKEILAELEALGERPPAISPDDTLPATVDDYGERLVLAKRGLAMFQAEAEALRKASLALVIKDQAGGAVASEYKATAQKISKRIDAKVKEITQDATDYIQGVRNFAANLKAPLAEVKTELDGKIGVWSQFVRVEREKQERAAREALAREQEKLNKRAEKAGIEPVVLTEPLLPPQKTVIRTDTGTTFEVRKWKGTILDPDKVDRQYCSPDPKKIQEAIDGGAREISGVDIYEDVKMVTRTK